MQSEQIRWLLPRTVTPVSLRYPQLLCVLGAFSLLRCATRRELPTRRKKSTRRELYAAPPRAIATPRQG
jgi:hypothetical protein